MKKSVFNLVTITILLFSFSSNVFAKRIHFKCSPEDNESLSKEFTAEVESIAEKEPRIDMFDEVTPAWVSGYTFRGYFIREFAYGGHTYNMEDLIRKFTFYKIPVDPDNQDRSDMPPFIPVAILKSIYNDQYIGLNQEIRNGKDKLYANLITGDEAEHFNCHLIKENK